MERRGMIPGNHATPIFIFNPKDRLPITYKKNGDIRLSPERQNSMQIHDMGSSSSIFIFPAYFRKIF
jgi:hypothetical protein